MNTFLTFPDYAECARVLDTNRINTQINVCTIILRSCMRMYPIHPINGFSGYENNAVSFYWKDHLLQLSRYALACTIEYMRRPLGPKGGLIFADRRERSARYKALVEHMEDNQWDDSPPMFFGEDDFHSGFRSWLLYKECQKMTFDTWKAGGYPDHAVTRRLLPKKASWKRSDYISVWEYFGRPKPVWYGQFGWLEEPDDTKMFYAPDKSSRIEDRLRRKKEKPLPGYLMKHLIKNNAH